MKDRRRGALIGLAVGDALGAAVEFQSPGDFPPITCYRADGPHRLNPGEWTDDTSLALALADSIATAEWDLNDQARRYVEWWKTGKYSVNGSCFDIGFTTRRALSNFIDSQDATRSGDASERASGNGSIMRLAPLPIRYCHLFPNHIDSLSKLAEESSLTTHASEQCRSACRYMALVLVGLIVDRRLKGSQFRGLEEGRLELPGEVHKAQRCFIITTAVISRSVRRRRGAHGTTCPSA